MISDNVTISEDILLLMALQSVMSMGTSLKNMIMLIYAFICFNLSERLVFMQVFSDFPVPSLTIFIFLLKNFLSRSQTMSKHRSIKTDYSF